MKTSLFVLAALASCLTMNGQIVTSNDQSTNADNVSAEVRQSSSSSEDDNASGGIDVDYYGIEKGWGIGLEAHRGFLIGWMYSQGETNDMVTSNYTWGMHLGYNYRHWIVPKVLYVEGRAGIGYADSKLEMTTYKTTTTTTEGRYLAGHYLAGRTYTSTSKQTEDLGGSDFYLMMSPRIGVNIYKFKNGGGIGLAAGYRWSFTKFKFDKDHTADFFTAGISIIY